MDGSFTAIIHDYNKKPAFSDFLPGIAGLYGTPAWCFFVNRGQCVASFGKSDKDHAIMEFMPAHSSYQLAETRGFRSFVKDWPQSPYRPDALYWLGSSAFAAEQYKTAISTQNQLLREYPKSVLAPDAMLLVASSQAASGSVNAAKATLRKVIKQYPKTSSAETAQKRLDEIQRASAKKSK